MRNEAARHRSDDLLILSRKTRLRREPSAVTDDPSLIPSQDRRFYHLNPKTLLGFREYSAVENSRLRGENGKERPSVGRFLTAECVCSTSNRSDQLNSGQLPKKRARESRNDLPQTLVWGILAYGLSRTSGQTDSSSSTISIKKLGDPAPFLHKLCRSESRERAYRAVGKPDQVPVMACDGATSTECANTRGAHLCFPC